MIRQIQYFKRVLVPKIVEAKIQDCAIEHLGVRDIGKLRDKYEGQRYYDQLRFDIISEFVFEKYLELGEFDWEKRKLKTYKRKEYEFEKHKINLINFPIGTFPKFNPDDVINAVFVYIKPDLKCYVSGLGTTALISEIAGKPLQYSPLNPEMKEIRDFSKLVPFENLEQLMEKLDTIKI